MPKAYIIARRAISYQRYITRSAEGRISLRHTSLRSVPQTGGFFLFFLVIVATDGTHGIVKIVEDAAVGTGALGQVAGLVLVGSKGALSVHIGAVEFQLAAAGAAEEKALQARQCQTAQRRENGSRRRKNTK